MLMTCGGVGVGGGGGGAKHAPVRVTEFSFFSFWYFQL